MDFREEAATSGVPRNRILVLSSSDGSSDEEEEERRRESDVARCERRGRNAVEGVDALCRLQLVADADAIVDADGPIRRPLLRRVPTWKPWHDRRTHAAITEIAMTRAAECLTLTEFIMEM